MERAPWVIVTSVPSATPPAPERPEPGEDDALWIRRVACAEINGRRVNEAIDRGHTNGGNPVFLCECGRVGCATKVSLSQETYDRVRTSFDRFVLAPGHELPLVDAVVEIGNGFVIVEKRGNAAVMARNTDPRQQQEQDR